MMKFLGQDNMPQARGKDPVCLLIQRCLQTEEPREEALLLAGLLSLLLFLVLALVGAVRARKDHPDPAP